MDTWGLPRKTKAAMTGAGIPNSNTLVAQKCETTNTSHPTARKCYGTQISD